MSNVLIKSFVQSFLDDGYVIENQEFLKMNINQLISLASDAKPICLVCKETDENHCVDIVFYKIVKDKTAYIVKHLTEKCLDGSYHVVEDEDLFCFYFDTQ
jgi:hypothetical protein